MSEKDGGPAFPRSGVPTVTGMTLRQFYKAAALQSTLIDDDMTPNQIAVFCGLIADVMLKEDEEQKDNTPLTSRLKEREKERDGE